MALVMYGNRAYEDALLELSDFLEKHNFSVIGGCAFIGEHSYSTDRYPIAQGRPDLKDINIAEEEGHRIYHKLTNAENREKENPATFAHLSLPGNRPYRQGIGASEISPVIERGRCVLCSNCTTACPTGALRIEGEIRIQAEHCILCCACIRACQEEAISLQAESLLEKMQWLNTECSKRKEPEIFL